MLLAVFPVGGQSDDYVIDLELVGADAVAPPGNGHGHQHHEDAHGEPRAGKSADHGHEESDDASAADGAPPADGRPVGFLLDDFHFDGQDILNAVFLALGLDKPLVGDQRAVLFEQHSFFGYRHDCYTPCLKTPAILDSGPVSGIKYGCRSFAGMTAA